jgi:hypothetical protein
MNGDVLHAIESLSAKERAAAFDGYRYIGLEAAATVLEDMTLRWGERTVVTQSLRHRRGWRTGAGNRAPRAPLARPWGWTPDIKEVDALPRTHPPDNRAQPNRLLTQLGDIAAER